MQADDGALLPKAAPEITRKAWGRKQDMAGPSRNEPEFGSRRAPTHKLPRAEPSASNDGDVPIFRRDPVERVGLDLAVVAIYLAALAGSLISMLSLHKLLDGAGPLHMTMIILLGLMIGLAILKVYLEAILRGAKRWTEGYWGVGLVSRSAVLLLATALFVSSVTGLLRDATDRFLLAAYGRLLTAYHATVDAARRHCDRGYNPRRRAPSSRR